MAQAKPATAPCLVNRRDRPCPVWETGAYRNYELRGRERPGWVGAMYQAVTKNIQVTVEPQFLPDESDVDASRFFFAYGVEIANLGRSIIQVRTRYWHITDGLGRVQEISGAGVVGEEPMLHPGRAIATRPAARSTRRPESWLDIMALRHWKAHASMWKFQPSRWMRRSSSAR
jgi:hypothetical protein